MIEGIRIRAVLFGIVAGVLGVLVLSQAAMAVQYRFAESDGEIVASISLREASRIALRGDRIASVLHLPRGFRVEHDAETGDIYMIPHGAVSMEPVNLFITSERGQTYQLLLTPRDIPSEQVIIAGSRQHYRAKGSSPRREELARLIRAMITGEMLDDYTRAAPVIADIDGINPVYEHLEILEVWQGEEFRGLRLGLQIRAGRYITPAVLVEGAAAGWLSDEQDVAIIVMEAGYE